MGGAWDPATDAWRKFGKTNAPELPLGGKSYSKHRYCVWSGRELWMWGDELGHAFNPSANTWRELAPVPGPAVVSDEGRAFHRDADGVLLIRQDRKTSIDRGTCSAWRYDGDSDRWRACARPPAVENAEPTIVPCGKRIVVVLDEHLFEYVAARDAWEPIPSPNTKDSPRVVWVADRLFAFSSRSGLVKSLSFPSA